MLRHVTAKTMQRAVRRAAVLRGLESDVNALLSAFISLLIKKAKSAVQHSHYLYVKCQSRSNKIFITSIKKVTCAEIYIKLCLKHSIVIFNSHA